MTYCDEIRSHQIRWDIWGEMRWGILYLPRACLLRSLLLWRCLRLPKSIMVDSSACLRDPVRTINLKMLSGRWKMEDGRWKFEWDDYNTTMITESLFGMYLSNWAAVVAKDINNNRTFSKTNEIRNTFHDTHERKKEKGTNQQRCRQYHHQRLQSSWVLL